MLDKLLNNFQRVVNDDYLNFYISSLHCGYVTRDMAKLLVISYPNDFYLKEEKSLYLDDKYKDFLHRTELFDTIATFLFSNNYISLLRDEYILVQDIHMKHKVMKVKRDILQIFGFLSQGVHCNAFVQSNNNIHLWISKRSDSVLYPNLLDTTVGGAMSFGLDMLQTLIKESQEEASIPKSIALKAKYQTSLSYIIETKEGLRNDIMHIFDLHLEKSLIPKPFDNETQQFMLLPCEQLAEHLFNNISQYKYNSILAILNFLLHHNAILDKNYHASTTHLLNRLTNSRFYP